MKATKRRLREEHIAKNSLIVLEHHEPDLKPTSSPLSTRGFNTNMDKDSDVCAAEPQTVLVDAEKCGESNAIQSIEHAPESSGISTGLEDSIVKNQPTPGIIYLSSIPDGMQYNDVYRVFSELGQIGRISLQSGGPQPHSKRRKNFKEGWVEFIDKKKAKRCVMLLNNQTVGGKKKSKWFDCIWHMKYLPKFQWHHLTERLAYEQAILQQRMRTEITQARREAAHFSDQLDVRQRDIRMSQKKGDWKANRRKYEYSQRLTDDEIRKRKVGSERVQKLEKSRTNVLGSLFSKTKSAE